MSCVGPGTVVGHCRFSGAGLAVVCQDLLRVVEHALGRFRRHSGNVDGADSSLY